MQAEQGVYPKRIGSKKPEQAVGINPGAHVSSPAVCPSHITVNSQLHSEVLVCSNAGSFLVHVELVSSHQLRSAVLVGIFIMVLTFFSAGEIAIPVLILTVVSSSFAARAPEFQAQCHFIDFFVFFFILQTRLLPLSCLWLSLRHICAKKELNFWSKTKNRLDKSSSVLEAGPNRGSAF